MIDEARRCVGKTKAGVKCNIIMTVDTPEGPLCRYHRDLGPGRVRSPVRSIKSVADIARLTSWAAVACAEGRLSSSQAIAIKSMCAEWRLADGSGKTAEQTVRFAELAGAVMRVPELAEAVMRSDDNAVRAARLALRAAIGLDK